MASTLVAMASTLKEMASTLVAMASTLEEMASILVAMASTLEAMASTLEEMASTLVAMASTLEAMASTLEAMASTLVAMASTLVAMASTLEAVASTLEELQQECCMKGARSWAFATNSLLLRLYSIVEYCPFLHLPSFFTFLQTFLHFFCKFPLLLLTLFTLETHIEKQWKSSKESKKGNN